MPLLERAFLVAPLESLALAAPGLETVAETDLPELAAIEHRALRGTVDERGHDVAYRLAELQAHWEGRPGRRIQAGELLLRDSTRPVAFAVTSFLWGLPVVGHLAVDPDAQGRGHGTTLLRGLAHALEGEGFRVVAFRLSVENPLHGFLVHLGFEPHEFPGFGA